MYANNILKLNIVTKFVLKSHFHTSVALNKIKAGRYKITRDRTKPLTYEQSFVPEQIGHKKGFNRFVNV